MIYWINELIGFTDETNVEYIVAVVVCLLVAVFFDCSLNVFYKFFNFKERR